MILLGQDNCDLIKVLETRSEGKNALVASRTELGWVLHGNVPGKAANPAANATLCSRTTQWVKNPCHSPSPDYLYRELHDLVEEYFRLESIGEPKMANMSPKDQRAMSLLESTTRKRSGRWETGLLWRVDNVSLPDNKEYALRRLYNLEKKLDKDSKLAKLYYKEIDKLVSEGYASKVTERPQRGRTWYLPHFAVTHAEKPGRVRVVFDAAAEVKGTSLNNHLLAGPDLLNSLAGVLMRFRQRPVAFKADVRDMFLRIRVREEDRCFQRFLWRGSDREKEPETYEMSSLLFGAKSSPCSALFVKNKNAEQEAGSMPEALQAIKRGYYMDDYLDSADSVEDASRIIAQVAEVNARGGFYLHGWASNDRRALSSVTSTNRSQGGMVLLDSTTHTRLYEKTLGLSWDTRLDRLTFKATMGRMSEDIRSERRKPTKREVLRITMSIFDPLGLLAPFVVGSKILLQDIWRSGCGWDTVIGDHEFEWWRRWIRELPKVADLAVSRCYVEAGKTKTRLELHVFCDASEKAYAAVAYWRTVYEDDSCTLALIGSKSRVAPHKPVTIPRLELQAAVLACRLAHIVETEHDLKPNERFFWSDSRTVLSWISNDPRSYQTFVANRLGEIAESSNAGEWSWVPSAENPADDATRGTTDLSRWFTGPEFLTRTSNCWPTAPEPSDAEKEGFASVEKRMLFLIPATICEFPLPDIARFSSWKRLLRSAATVLLVRDKWRAFRRSSGERRALSTRRGKSALESPFLDLNLLEEAEILLLRQSQTETFPQEVAALKRGLCLGKSSRIIKLSPHLDDKEIMRVQGRTTGFEVPGFNNRPVILYGKHPTTRLLVAHYHEKVGHGNSELVLNEIRQRYWIVKARATLQTITHKCQVCRIRRAKPLQPRMADLPAARLAHHQRPFYHCGIDYFGPMMVAIGRRREKRWGVIFTCLTTRAIHLEIASSLNSDAAIMAIRRMAARRGQPMAMYSDNGTNLRGANEELRAAVAELDQAKLNEYALEKDMRWNFIPPSAPHMGGAWERMIGCVKVALRPVLKEQAPKEDTLGTLMAEVEHIVNSRPLTHVSIDPDDKEALTPNHFLIGGSSGWSLPGRYEQLSTCPRKQWRIAQEMANQFWHRWIREYLPTLMPRNKWSAESETLSVGDVVLIVDYQAPRNQWLKGVVKEVFPGQDGRIRVARVTTTRREVTRPVVKLIKLATAERGYESSYRGEGCRRRDG